MPQKNNESKIILALQAMQNDPKLSAQAARKIYSINHQKLSHCRCGIQLQCDIPANSWKLTDLEESVLVQYILDLAAKGFPPGVSVVEDMANRLLTTCNMLHIGMCWASNFINRRPELRTRFQRKYNY